MNRAIDDEAIEERWSRWWRVGTIILGALILCSCRSTAERSAGTVTSRRAAPPAVPRGDSLPGEAWSGDSSLVAATAESAAGEASVSDAAPPRQAEPGVAMGPAPLPYDPTGPWAPPGLRRPWPPDEYLRDGGDRELPAEVGNQWQVRGLESEDTIAHYDTLDGRTLVEPSNPVHIYSPRFGAVRQVVSLVANAQLEGSRGLHLDEAVEQHTEQRLAQAGTQHYQAVGQVAATPPTIFESRQGDGVMSTAAGPAGFQDALLPYANLSAIRDGVVVAEEAAMLAKASEAALVWQSQQAPQVILDRQAAMAEIGDVKLQTVYTVGQPPGNPRLRLIKIASTPIAQSGDEIDFTLRFDNVGNQLIGNVTIIDSLTGRLEYVEGSAQCSREATFSTQPNEAGSLVIRCEVTDPLEPGQGGVIRFRCRVR